ncbi:protein DOP1B [Rhinophrynus dorsalis]
MDPEEQELLGDYRYRNYSSVIEKALRNFESSSEWADLISSLGKLNKALQSNLKYCLLPRRLIITKRLAQCLHPALPSGVHLKALETYEIIFKIIGTKWLAKDLFLYSSGLFPLLSHAAMSARPILLGLYETYFIPLQKALLPSLQAFITGLLPGLEEGSEIYERTDLLLQRLSTVVGPEVFYGSLWGSVLVSSSIRLPASLFVVSHINRDLPTKEQGFMLGNDHQLAIKSLCVSVLDSNVLVQRNTLEILLYFFPFHTCLEPNECPISLLRSDLIRILSGSIQTVLRRDMSLNRRLFAWLLGFDIKGRFVASDLTVSAGEEEYCNYFFAKYSKDLLVQAMMQILHQNILYSDSEQGLQTYLKPFRIIVSLLDKPEIGNVSGYHHRVAHVLWNQLNMETREHHITCVELFYRLHCLAPSANICEEIICQTLLDNDKLTRLEALFRFSVIWHLTREIQGSRVTSHNRSFDRSLFVVLDSLNCSDGAIGAAAQGWLVRALSLNDVARILEPVLLLLLHPKTQRNSIHCIKQKNSSEEMNYWFRKKRTSLKDNSGLHEFPESGSEENLTQFNTVDREAIWAEVEKDPEKMKNEWTENHTTNFNGHPFCVEDDQDDSENTESADTSSGHNDSDNTSSFTPSSVDLSNEQNIAGQVNIKHTGQQNVDIARHSTVLSIVRTESDVTQTSESLSSDDEADVELQAIRSTRLLKQQKEKEEMIEALFKHILLYLQPYDSKRVLYAFSVLEAILKTNPKEFIEAVASTSMDTSSTAHLNLIYNLLARHQESLVGQSFYGKLQTQSPSMCPHSLLIELLTYLCLSFLRSYYPCYLKVSHKDVLGNRDVQVKSVEVLIRIISQLANTAKCSEGKNVAFIHSLLERCKVQEFVLLSLSASMYTSQKKYELVSAGGNKDLDEGLFEESIINFGQDQIWSEHPLQIELLKLLQVLILLEHHLRQLQEDQDSPADLSKEWQRGINFQQSINAMQYIQSHAITSQGLFVSAVVRALRPDYGYGMHPPWVTLVTSSLPYFGKSLGLTVAPFVAQICKNLDELVKQYENESVKFSKTSKRENISPDYPLTLLEGLTTIGHFCLLEHPTHTKKSSSSSDPANLKNARNALLEELPRIINSMSLLWSVITRQEKEKRPSDLLGTIKASSSVYFKTTKTLKQKILDFLNPLTSHLGVQLIAAVAAVWKRKRFNKSQSKAKIIPVPSDSQLTLVDLICALKTLKTDTILQLVKEVVKKPPQIKGEEKSSLVDIPMLQFSYAFIQRLSASDMQENFQSLLALLKESVPLNLAPPGFFLLLSMLNDFVTRTPNLEHKKDQKDLQEVTQKILESVGNVAGSSLEQTSWLSRNLEVKAQPQVSLDDAETEEELNDDSAAAAQSSMVSSSAPSVYSVQALTILAEVLATLLDMVYRSDEKEKAVPLISRLLYYVFPYLRNHSAYNAPSFRAGAQLLSSLSGYAYTKRAWKKDVLDLYMDPGFFQMDTSCIHWKSIIDHLLTHEKTMFKDLMNMPSSSLKLYSSNEQKAMLLKRQSFAVFSGELDQYHLYLPLIQERLTENIRTGQTPIMAAQMFLFFRVLLLRISPQHLTSLWPIMVTELIHAFVQLQEDLVEEEPPSKSNKANKQKAAAAESNGPVYTEIQQGNLDLYLSASKFLDTSLSFPPDRMPLFQMYRWAFVPEVDTDSCITPTDKVENHQECKPHVIRIMELLKLRFGENISEETKVKRSEFPLLTLRSIANITQLTPFFKTLCYAFKTKAQGSKDSPQGDAMVEYPVEDCTRVLKELEENVESDFLEIMGN